jgi:hypothetical protein
LVAFSTLAAHTISTFLVSGCWGDTQDDMVSVVSAAQGVAANAARPAPRASKLSFFMVPPYQPCVHRSARIDAKTLTELAPPFNARFVPGRRGPAAVRT